MLSRLWPVRSALVGAVLLAACGKAQVGPEESQDVILDAPNFPMTRSLPAPNTYRTALANVRAGAPIVDAFGNVLGTVNNTNPKEFHVFERVPATIGGTATRLYWMRGAYTDETVSGFIIEEYIENPTALAAEIDLRVANGNGQPMPVEGSGRFTLQPISSEMHYPGPSDGVCRTYEWYGIRGTYPGEGPQAGVAYTYLVWSLPNVRGGGLNRTIIRDGESFQFTKTHPVQTKAYRSASGSGTCGEEVGWIEWRYVRVDQNGHSFYGWAVNRSYFADEGVVKVHIKEN